MATVTKGTEVQVSFANTYSADKTYTVEYYFETGHGTGVYNIDNSKLLTNQTLRYGQTKQ